MNDDERQFEDFVSNIKFDDTPDPGHRDRLEDDLLAALAKRPRHKRAMETWRIIMRSRTTKIAAAAVTIIAVLIGVKMLGNSAEESGREIVKQQNIPQKEVTVEVPEETKPSLDEKLQAKLAAEKVEAELKNIEQMFAAGDIPGLLGMLDKGQWESKVAAANYLAKIGDSSAIDALGSLVEKWQGDTADNPFATAISEIAARLVEDEQETQQADTAEDEAATAPATVTTAAPQKTIVFKGVVTNEAGDPIEGTIVRSDMTYYTPFRFAVGEAYSSVDAQGLFQIGPLPEIDKKKASRTLIFDHPDYAIGWFTPNVSRDVDSNSVAITLLEPSFVIGRVIDGRGSPVEGATVRATMQVIIDGKHYYYYLGETNDLAVTTDADGFFVFERSRI